jgi:hypothetical protein
MFESQPTIGLIVVGIFLMVASLLVDLVGIGTEGFGAVQIAGLILGIVSLVVGVYRVFIRQKTTS